MLFKVDDDWSLLCSATKHSNDRRNIVLLQVSSSDKAEAKIQIFIYGDVKTLVPKH